MKTIAILIATYFVVFAAGFCSGAYMIYFSDKPIIISSVNNGLRMIDIANNAELLKELVIWAMVFSLGILTGLMIGYEIANNKRKNE